MEEWTGESSDVRLQQRQRELVLYSLRRGFRPAASTSTAVHLRHVSDKPRTTGLLLSENPDAVQLPRPWRADVAGNQRRVVRDQHCNSRRLAAIPP